MQNKKSKDLAGTLRIFDEEGDTLEKLKGYGNKANTCEDMDGLFGHKSANKQQKKCKKAYRSAEVDGRAILYACVWDSANEGCIEGDVATDVSECHTGEDADEEKKEWWAAWRQGIGLGGASFLMIGAGVKVRRRRRSKSAGSRVAIRKTNNPLGIVPSNTSTVVTFADCMTAPAQVAHASPVGGVIIGGTGRQSRPSRATSLAVTSALSVEV